LVGQLTFFISSLTSFKKVMTLFGIFAMFISQRELRSLFHLRPAVCGARFLNVNRKMAKCQDF
jgi:hypothetical protein